MGRPKKNNAEYFSHDANMRDDIKIKALRRKFSHMGYAVWNYLLETLTNSDFFEIEWNEINIELLAADYDVTTEELTDIVNYSIKIGLLNIEDGKLFSLTHKQRLEVVSEYRERQRANGKKGGNPNFKKGQDNPYFSEKTLPKDNPEISGGYDFSEKTLPKDNPEITIVKESKVKKSKDIIIPPVYIPPLQGGNTHTELSESDKPPEQDNCVTTESPPVAEEKEKSSAKKEKEPVKRFQKPTIEEVKAYIAEKGYDVDAERFWNFYEAKDWFIGKNKMKNWHAAVATWQKKETDYVDIKQKRHDRRRGSEIRATCAEDYSEPL